MRRLLLLPAAALALAAPVSAQETDLIKLAALVVGGLAEGETTLAGGPAAVTSPGPGFFVATPATGAALNFEVAQPEPCLFTVSLNDPATPVTIRFDANKIRSLGVLLIEEQAGLFAYRITFSGNDGKLLVETAKETFAPPVDTWPMYSSIDLEGVRKAIDDLRVACPGLSP
jgi:hypothetical protein